MKASPFILILLFCGACIKEIALKPLDQYYGFQDIKEIKTVVKRPKEIILGVDNATLNLSSFLDTKFFTENSVVLNGTSALLNFYIDNEIVKEGVYNFKKEGNYELVAKLGEIATEPINIVVYDTTKLSVRVAVPQNQLTDFEADGIQSLDFKFEAIYDGKQIPIPEGFTLFINDVNTSKIDQTKFNTLQPKLYVFNLRRGNYSGKDLVVDGVSPVKKIKIEPVFINGTVDKFYNDGFSRCNINVVGIGKNGNKIPLSEDIKLFKNGQNLGLSPSLISFTTRVEGITTFQFKGYKIESESFRIEAFSPPNSQTIKLPVVFHSINAKGLKLSESALEAAINEVNSLFRNNANTLIGQPISNKAADTFVEFYLASKDPNGQNLQVKGLHLVSNAPASFNKVNDIFKNNFIVNTQWNPKQYVNIFLCDFTGEVFSAFAFLPANKIVDNKIVYSNLDKSFSESIYGAYMNNTIEPKVIAHELGHMLGLRHSFGALKNCTSNLPDDYCEDTPDYDFDAYLLNINSSRYNRTSCKNQNFVSTNIMDYGLTHSNNFTQDQKEIIRNFAIESESLPNGSVSPVLLKLKVSANLGIPQPVICDFSLKK